jgi:hypothetical protein
VRPAGMSSATGNRTGWSAADATSVEAGQRDPGGDVAGEHPAVRLGEGDVLLRHEREQRRHGCLVFLDRAHGHILADTSDTGPG